MRSKQILCTDLMHNSKILPAMLLILALRDGSKVGGVMCYMHCNKVISEWLI